MLINGVFAEWTFRVIPLLSLILATIGTVLVTRAFSDNPKRINLLGTVMVTVATIAELAVFLIQSLFLKI
jgi:hypothetical protein